MNVAGYETVVGLAGWRELITRRAVDIVQPDVVWNGGFTETRRVAALAHAFNLLCAPHAFGSAVTLQAALHLVASIPNGIWLEFDQNPNPLRSELAKEPLQTDAEGMVRLPERPGLGLELEPSVVERYRATTPV
jgi:L-alanine-DL-glutamate epimerase-like enolase superfamily enzyme